METKEVKRRQSRTETGKRKKQQAKPHRRAEAGPEVVYTQPKPFNRSKFLLRLLTVLAVVLALTLGMSIFFKVGVITVAGNEKYSAWDVRQASGIQDGENLLTLSKARIAGRIMTGLPYVESVRIGIKLPDTVHIEITELAVSYAIEDRDGAWWLMDSQGRLLEQITGIQAKSYTRVLGVQIADARVGAQAVAVEPEPEKVTQTDPSTGETVQMTIPVTVRGAERLHTALSVLQYLEDNGILGAVTSVDVTNMGAMQLWYGERYRVELGDDTQLSYKIKSMKQAIDQMSEYQTGILDVSFTIWPDQVGYTAFDEG